MKYRVILACFVVLGITTPALADEMIYDLTADWSDVNNPNDVWAYRQGTIVLPHQSDIGTPCCGGPSSGIGGGWAPGSVPRNFLPFWVMAIGDNTLSGFLAGDIIVHSVDGFNGNPGLGEANVTWTALVAGMIDISGSIWYAQLAVDRSNDFLLMLNGTTLASGTVCANCGWVRDNPLRFDLTGLSVDAGDVLEFLVERSPGQTAGSIAGVNLTITETPSSVPGPARASSQPGLPSSRWRRLSARTKPFCTECGKPVFSGKQILSSPRHR